VHLNTAAGERLSMMLELLAEGFGVLEGEQLMFHSYEPADGRPNDDGD